MKCQRCAKQATYHVTEVFGDEKFDEHHLCEDCAKKYFNEPGQSGGKKSSGGKTATEQAASADPGGKHCDACGLKFVEFRNSGRLGCPHDYDAFREELLPLLESIHGDVKHAGKAPRKTPKAKSGPSELSHLRKKLAKAVADEAYEDAARLRDKIKELEQG